MSIFNEEIEEKQYGDGVQREVNDYIRRTSTDLNDKIKAKVAARLEQENKNHPENEDNLAIADPMMDYPTGMFSAWLISAKNMSPADAFKFGQNSENYEEYANEFADFIAISSVLANEITGDIISSAPDAIAKVLKDANAALKDYKVPDFDVYDLEKGQDALLELNGISNMTAEIETHVKAMQTSPYKFKISDSDINDAYLSNKSEENTALNTFVGEAVPDDKMKEKMLQTTSELSNRSHQAFELKSIMENVYYPDYSYNPIRMLVLRNKVKDFMNKSLDEIKTSVGQLDAQVSKIADDIATSTAMKNIPEARIIDRLLGKKDNEIDDIIAVKGAAKIAVSAVKAQSMKKNDVESIKKRYRKKYTENIKKQKNAELKASGHDFKLRVEIAGNDIASAIEDVKSKDSVKDIQADLQQIRTSISTIHGVLKALNAKVNYNFEGTQVKDVKPAWIYQNNGDDGRFISEDYYENIVEANNNIKQAVDAIKQNEDYDKLPQEVKDIVEASENVYTFDKNFYDWIEEYPLHTLGLDATKKDYADTFEFVKNDNKDVEMYINVAKKAKSADAKFTIGKLVGILTSNDSLEKAEVSDVQVNEPVVDNAIDEGTFNVKEYIENLQSHVDTNQNNMTFDDFTKMLAARSIADAKRNSFMGNSLNKEVSKTGFDILLDTYKNDPSVKTAFQYAKVDPKRWAAVNKAFKTGHGGGIEDYYKNTLKAANFADIPQGDEFARYRPTVKEKIEFIQNLVKNGSQKLTSASTDIIICRNVAGAEKNNKGKLDFVMSDDFIKKAVEQEKILTEHKAFNKMVREIDREQLKDLITTGHGGAMSELIRTSADKTYTLMKNENEVLSVLWQNTVKGMKDRINAEFDALKNNMQDIADYNNIDNNNMEDDDLKHQNALVFDDDDNIIPTVEELKPDVNTAMKRNIAQSVVISEIYKKKVDGSVNEFAADFAHGDYVQQVDKLMASPDFNKVYTEMMKKENQVEEMNVDNINAKYNEIRHELGLDGKKAQKGKQNEPEKQVENKAPAIN
ncbi:MAG: hypothetical protein K5659_09960 [Lachnospiraceae bacterium]|nr:hypothetical protein [Lachnospiraceae bacterium]